MTYYNIKNSLDDRQLGIGQQVKKTIHNCHIKDPMFIDNWNTEVSKKPICPDFQLEEKAKATDLINNYNSIGARNKLIISDRLKNIIENYRYKGLEFFQTFVFHKQESYNYWITTPNHYQMEIIDYKKSEIWVMKGGWKKLEKTNNINSSTIFFQKKQEYRNGYKNDKTPHGLTIERVCFKKNIDLDFFSLIGANGYFVSERLKSSIEAENCTGIEFVPSEMSYEESLKFLSGKAK